MTEQEMILNLTLSVPEKFQTNAQAMAKNFLSLALSKMSRMDEVDFNRSDESFSLRSGVSRYQLGKDLFAKWPNIGNMREFYLTGYQNPVPIVSLNEYRLRTAGLTDSGRPEVATIHSAEGILEVFPTPDSNYAAVANLRRNILRLDEVPTAFHDVVYTYAVTLIQAAANASMAVSLNAQNIDEMKDDARNSWMGDTFGVARTIDQGRRATRATSYNLTGE